MSEETTRDKVRLLAAERPDLIPHLRRCLELGSEGTYDDVPQEALDEFTRRGILVKEWR